MLTNPDISDIVRKTDSYSRRVFGSKHIDTILYGPYARGKASEGSVLNVMALADFDSGELEMYIEEFEELKRDISASYGPSVEIVLQDLAGFLEYPDEASFFASIEDKKTDA